MPVEAVVRYLTGLLGGPSFYYEYLPGVNKRRAEDAFECNLILTM